MASLLNMSGGSLLNKGLPYDAEIEYLEISRGNTEKAETLIRTENIFSDRGYLNIKVILYNEAVNEAYPIVFCIDPTKSNITGNWWIYRTAIYKERNTNAIQFEYGSGDRYTSKTYPLTINYTDRSYYVATDAGLDTKKYLLLTNGVHARWYYLQIKDSNKNILFDMIPVRKGSKGCLYDRVSGKLYSNLGTSSFILGPDKQ